MTTKETPCGPLSWVLTKDALKQLLAAINNAEEVVLDLETTGLHEYAKHGGPVNGGVAARIALAALTLPEQGVDYIWGTMEGPQPRTWIVPLSHPSSPFLGQWRKVMAIIAREIRDSGKPFVNANIKFDARWIWAQTGIDLSDRIEWDTQVSSHLVDTEARTRLKVRAARDFDIEEWDDFDLSTPGAAERVDLFQLGEYAARDTYWTWKLEQKHKSEMFLDGEDYPIDADDIQRARLGKVARWVSIPTVKTLTKVEQHGILLDTEWVEERLAVEKARKEEAAQRILDRYSLDPLPQGGITTAATSKWFQALTEKAIEEGHLRITAMTDAGNAQWSKAVLLRQAREGSETAHDILEHRAATKLMEYMTSWMNLRDENNLIHATYNVGRVITGRLSSSSPNMQQVTKSLKPAFIPRPGTVFLDLDYSQIELRVAAAISRCAPMIEAFQRGDDLHRLFAAKMTGKAPEDVLSLERTRAKAGNFGLLYGMSPGGFQTYAADVYDVALTLDEAFEVHEAFFDMWQGMREWHENAKSQAHRRGFVTSPIGRVQWLSDLYSYNPQRVSHAERNALNSPVQGFGSDLMQMAAASVMGTLPGFAAVKGAHVVVTVHDEIGIEAPEDDWERVLIECKERMEDVNTLLRPLDYQIDVPIVASPTVGTRWGLDDILTEDDPLPAP